MASTGTTPYLDEYTARFSFARGASRAYGAMPRSKEHLHKALGEIDGLFAGSRYLDKIESTSNASTPSNVSEPSPSQTDPASVEAPRDELGDELSELSRHSDPSDPSRDDVKGYPVPDAHVWSSIQDVRQGMEEHWLRFDKISRQLNIPAINNIREDYGNAIRLRETGTFAFRNMLTGPAPNQLKDIFALVSLSYVVSSLLHAKGRIHQKDILEGVHIWLDALPNEAERLAFNEIAVELWPESRNHLHSFQLNISEEAKKTLARLQDQGKAGGAPHLPLHPCPPLANNDKWADGTANTTQSTGCYDMSDLGDLPMADLMEDSSWMMQLPEQLAGEHIFQLTSQTTEEFDWTQFKGFPDPNMDVAASSRAYDFAFEPYNDTGQVASPKWPAPDDPDISQRAQRQGRNPPQSGDYCPQRHEFELAKRLQDTAVFRAVLFYLQLYGDLAYLLSGLGLTAKESRVCLAYTQEGKAKKKIHKDLLARLRRDKPRKGSAAQAILSITKRFVECGYIQSVWEAQNYMISFAKLVLRDSHACSRFQCWVLGVEMKNRNPNARFMCPKCNKPFTRGTNMRRHAKGSCPKRDMMM